MKSLELAGGPWFRLWICDCGDWEPGGWEELPTSATAVAPAAEGLATSEQAAAYIEGFNSQALREPLLAGKSRLWAIAVPVELRYAGEPRGGQTLAGEWFERCRIERSRVETIRIGVHATSA